MRRMRLLCGLLLSLAMLPPAHAVVDAVVREALSLTETGRAREAYDRLEPLEAQRAGDPDFDTVFGIAANLVGEHARAILALERVMVVQPGNTRARAELGRAMFAAGDPKSARKLLDEAKGQGVPADVASTIDQFLRAIERADAERQSTVRGHVEVNGGADTNASTGPGSANVAVPLFGGVVNFTLNPANVKQHSNFLGGAAGVNLRHVIDSRLSLIGGVSGSQRWYARSSAFNNTQLALNGGLSYRSGKDDYSAVFVHDSYLLRGTTVRIQNGLIAEWTNRRDQSSQMGAYAQVSRLSYPGARFRDATRLVLGGSYAQMLRSDLVAYGGLYLGQENALTNGRDDQGHRLQGLRLGGQLTLNEAWSLFAGATFEHRKYDAPHVTFLTVRSDNQWSLNLGGSWTGIRNWRITPQLSYTDLKSNIPINAYDRTQISVTARYEF